MRANRERDRKSKSGRKRGRPSLGPRVMVKLYVRPDTARGLRELARVRAVPVNFIGQAALDDFFRSLVQGADVGDVPDGPTALKVLADASAERAIREMSMGVPRT